MPIISFKSDIKKSILRAIREGDKERFRQLREEPSNNIEDDQLFLKEAVSSGNVNDIYNYMLNDLAIDQPANDDFEFLKIVIKSGNQDIFESVCEHFAQKIETIRQQTIAVINEHGESEQENDNPQEREEYYLLCKDLYSLAVRHFDKDFYSNFCDKLNLEIKLEYMLSIVRANLESGNIDNLMRSHENETLQGTDLDLIIAGTFPPFHHRIIPMLRIYPIPFELEDKAEFLISAIKSGNEELFNKILNPDGLVSFSDLINFDNDSNKTSINQLYSYRAIEAAIEGGNIDILRTVIEGIEDCLGNDFQEQKNNFCKIFLNKVASIDDIEIFDYIAQYMGNALMEEEAMNIFVNAAKSSNINFFNHICKRLEDVDKLPNPADFISSIDDDLLSDILSNLLTSISDKTSKLQKLDNVRSLLAKFDSQLENNIVGAIEIKLDETVYNDLNDLIRDRRYQQGPGDDIYPRNVQPLQEGSRERDL